MAESVLIVDDAVTLAESMAKLLQIAGHKAVLADSIEGALELARSHRPDCVLVDWDLGPDQPTGAVVVRTLRGVHPGARYAIWSGLMREELPDDVTFFLKDSDGIQSVLAWVAS